MKKVILVISTLFVIISCKKKEETPTTTPTPQPTKNNVIFIHNALCLQKLTKTYASIKIFSKKEDFWSDTNFIWFNSDTAGATTVKDLYVDSTYYYVITADAGCDLKDKTDKQSLVVKSGDPLKITYNW